MESQLKGESVQHLAGIVPIASPPLEFKMPWHDCLLPIAPEITALEKSIYECAIAGCQTIWVVGHMKLEPIIKKKIGNFIVDPVSIDRYTNKLLKEIPIYFVPIHPRDKNRRDCLSWSAMYGARIAYFISRKLSTWILPEKFFCSFPYGITDFDVLRENRFLIRSTSVTSFQYNNLSVKDNVHMNFTFNEKDYFSCCNTLKQTDLEEWQRTNRGSMFYDLKTALKSLDISDSKMIQLPWFYDISTWDGYREYISSSHYKNIKFSKGYFSKSKKDKY